MVVVAVIVTVAVVLAVMSVFDAVASPAPGKAPAWSVLETDDVVAVLVLVFIE